MGADGASELSRMPVFSGTPPETFAAPQLRWTRRRYRAGQIVFDRDAPERDVLFVVSGSLMAVYWTEDGRELVFSKMRKGSYLGEIAALDKGRRSVSVYAQVTSEVIVLEHASFLWLIDEVPAFRARIMQDLVGRVRQLTERMSALLSQSVEQRVRAYVARLALESGQLRAGGLIAGAPTHAEIAGSVGANREAVSRAISALSRAGIIESARQRIRILRPEELEAGAELRPDAHALSR